MKVLLAAKPKVRGAFQCNKCSSILEVHEHDMNSEEEFECPICKKVNHIEESINVDFLLTMRGIRDEITSDNLEIRITRYQAHVYYKDLDIGYISYGTRVKNGLIMKIINHYFYNDIQIFQKEYISDEFNPYIEETKELFLNKIKEVNPVIEEYAQLLTNKKKIEEMIGKITNREK